MNDQQDIGGIRVNITATAKRFFDTVDRVENRLTGLERNAKRSSTGLTAAAVTLGNIASHAIIAAMQKITKVIGESTTAAEEASSSMAKLATVMTQRGATQSQYNEIIKLTEAEQKLGVVSASVQQNGLQELATYVGKAKSLKKLTGVMNNLIVQQHGYNANAEQALQTATMMGKVIQGQTGGMERIGYHLTDAEKKLFNYGTEEERVALLTEIVNNNLGNLNHALGATPVGKQKQLANSWADCRAQIGALVTIVRNALVPVFSGIINVIATAIGYVKKFLALFGVDTSHITAGLTGASNATGGIADNLGDAVDNAKKLNKQLASFDEMNVLNDNKSDKNSGSGVDILDGIEASAKAIDWGGLIPDIKLPKSWENVAKKVKEFFKGFDFEKISNALKQFKKDVDRFLSPVGQIFSDLWDYIKPFIYWVGNDLLPAFLNALGGAIALLGSIIETAWPVLKALIDIFLVPIAQFTGGVIVAVLNGIGDALRWISEQQAVVDLIVGVGLALGVVAGYDFLVAFINTLAVSFGGLAASMTGIPILLADTGIAIGATNAGVQAGTAVAGGLTAAFGALKAAFMSVAEVAAAIAPPLLVAWGVFEAGKTMFEMSEFAAKNYRSEQDRLKDATTRAAKASNDQKKALEEVQNTQLAASDAELQLLELTKQATEKRNKYNEMIKSGKYSREKLTEAQLEAEIAEGRLQAQLKTLKEATTKAMDAQDEHHDAIMREIAATKEAELRQKVIAGKYDEVRSALIELSSSTETFKLKSGETYTLTAEEAKAMAADINDALDDGQNGYSHFLDEIKGYAGDFRKTMRSMRDSAYEVWSKSENQGTAFAQGISRGIIKNKWVVESAARELAAAGKMAYDQAMGIKSPSRVMMKSGRFVSAGVAAGIDDNAGEVKNAAGRLANITESAFANFEPAFADVSHLDITSAIKTGGAIQLDETEQEPMHVQVNIGEETLVDKIISALNNASFMRNTAVINV